MSNIIHDEARASVARFLTRSKRLTSPSGSRRYREMMSSCSAVAFIAMMIWSAACTSWSPTRLGLALSSQREQWHQQAIHALK
jgi:hypothetical protein